MGGKPCFFDCVGMTLPGELPFTTLLAPSTVSESVPGVAGGVASSLETATGPAFPIFPGTRLAKCSNDTALRDIRELLGRGIVVKNPGGGRSTSYRLAGLDEV
jgi:hypothetical protein